MDYTTNPNMAFLRPEDVTEIKKMLFNGTATQADIADQYLVAQATISRIAGGAMWPEIAWPDGKLGCMSPTRRYWVQKITRKKSARARFLGQARERLSPENTELSEDKLLREKEEYERKVTEQGELPRDFFLLPEYIEAPSPARAVQAIEKYRGMTMEQAIALGEKERAEIKEAPIPEPAPLPRKKKVKQELMLWKEVLQRAGKHELVVQAVKKKDKLLKRAIQIVYLQMQEGTWEEEHVVNLVLSTKKLLSKQE